MVNVINNRLVNYLSVGILTGKKKSAVIKVSRCGRVFTDRNPEK